MPVLYYSGFKSEIIGSDFLEAPQLVQKDDLLVVFLHLLGPIGRPKLLSEGDPAPQPRLLKKKSSSIRELFNAFRYLTVGSLYYIIDYMKTINALDARSRLGTVLDEVSQEGIHYVIKRLNEPLVVVVPFQEYQEIYKQNVSKKHKKELLDELAAFRRKYGKQLSGNKGTTQLLQDIRGKRTTSLLSLIK